MELTIEIGNPYGDYIGLGYIELFTPFISNYLVRSGVWQVVVDGCTDSERD